MHLNLWFRELSEHFDAKTTPSSLERFREFGAVKRAGFFGAGVYCAFGGWRRRHTRRCGAQMQLRLLLLLLRRRHFLGLLLRHAGNE